MNGTATVRQLYAVRFVTLRKVSVGTVQTVRYDPPIYKGGRTVVQFPLLGPVEIPEIRELRYGTKAYRCDQQKPPKLVYVDKLSPRRKTPNFSKQRLIKSDDPTVTLFGRLSVETNA